MQAELGFSQPGLGAAGTSSSPSDPQPVERPKLIPSKTDQGPSTSFPLLPPFVAPAQGALCSGQGTGRGNDSAAAAASGASPSHLPHQCSQPDKAHVGGMCRPAPHGSRPMQPSMAPIHTQTHAAHHLQGSPGRKLSGSVAARPQAHGTGGVAQGPQRLSQQQQQQEQHARAGSPAPLLNQQGQQAAVVQWQAAVGTTVADGSTTIRQGAKCLRMPPLVFSSLLGERSDHWLGWPDGIPIVLEVLAAGVPRAVKRSRIIRWNARDDILDTAGRIHWAELQRQWNGHVVQEWVLLRAGSYPLDQPEEGPDQHPSKQRATIRVVLQPEAEAAGAGGHGAAGGMQRPQQQRGGVRHAASQPQAAPPPQQGSVPVAQGQAAAAGTTGCPRVIPDPNKYKPIAVTHDGIFIPAHVVASMLHMEAATAEHIMRFWLSWPEGVPLDLRVADADGSILLEKQGRLKNRALVASLSARVLKTTADARAAGLIGRVISHWELSRDGSYPAPGSPALGVQPALLVMHLEEADDAPSEPSESSAEHGQVPVGEPGESESGSESESGEDEEDSDEESGEDEDDDHAAGLQLQAADDDSEWMEELQVQPSEQQQDQQDDDDDDDDDDEEEEEDGEWGLDGQEGEEWGLGHAPVSAMHRAPAGMALANEGDEEEGMECEPDPGQLQAPVGRPRRSMQRPQRQQLQQQQAPARPVAGVEAVDGKATVKYDGVYVSAGVMTSLLGHRSVHWKGWHEGVPVVLQVSVAGQLRVAPVPTFLKWADSKWSCSAARFYCRQLYQQFKGCTVQRWVLSRVGSYSPEQPDEGPKTYPDDKRACITVHVASGSQQAAPPLPGQGQSTGKKLIGKKRQLGAGSSADGAGARPPKARARVGHAAQAAHGSARAPGAGGAGGCNGAGVGPSRQQPEGSGAVAGAAGAGAAGGHVRSSVQELVGCSVFGLKCYIRQEAAAAMLGLHSQGLPVLGGPGMQLQLTLRPDATVPQGVSAALRAAGACVTTMQCYEKRNATVYKLSCLPGGLSYGQLLALQLTGHLELLEAEAGAGSVHVVLGVGQRQQAGTHPGLQVRSRVQSRAQHGSDDMEGVEEAGGEREQEKGGNEEVMQVEAAGMGQEGLGEVEARAGTVLAGMADHPQQLGGDGLGGVGGAPQNPAPQAVPVGAAVNAAENAAAAAAAAGPAVPAAAAGAAENNAAAAAAPPQLPAAAAAAAAAVQVPVDTELPAAAAAAAPAVVEAAAANAAGAAAAPAGVGVPAGQHQEVHQAGGEAAAGQHPAPPPAGAATAAFTTACDAYRAWDSAGKGKNEAKGSTLAGMRVAVRAVLRAAGRGPAQVSAALGPLYRLAVSELELATFMDGFFKPAQEDLAAGVEVGQVAGVLEEGLDQLWVAVAP